VTASAGTQRTVRDVQLVMLLNVATIPISLVTNVLLGRTAAELLGWYGALQIFVAVFNTFLVLGGLPVFSRLVPSMRESERIPFLLTYGAMMFGLLTAVAAIALAAPPVARLALGRFGMPRLAMAYCVCILVLVTNFASNFLYAVGRAPQAAAVVRFVIVGYFIASVAGMTLAREALIRDPAGFMWRSTLLVYAMTAIVGVAFVLKTPEVALRARMRAWLPPGFWPVVFYTHVGTIVDFSFFQFYPLMILVWLDVVALSRLHAAMRFVSLLAMAPVMLTAVLVPGLARLEASGQREAAVQQAGAALRGVLVAVVPWVFALQVFAPSAMAFFGADFKPYGQVLRLMAPMALAGPLVYLGGGMAIAFGAFRDYLWVSLLFVVTSVAFALVGIPRWGLVGAAAAGTVGSFVQQVAMSGVMRRKMGFHAPFRVSAAWIVALATGLVATVFEPGLALGSILWCASLAAFFWLGSVTTQELRILASRALRLS
jgi:O-antigen/teichoic acid export membrane protein